MNHHVSTLRQVIQRSQGLFVERELPQLYTHIVERVRTELQADRVVLMLWDDSCKSLSVAACVGASPDFTAGQVVELSSSLAGWVVRHHQPLLVDHARCLEHGVARTLPDDQLVFALLVPLIVEDRMLGVIYSGKTQAHGTFCEADQELLMVLASQITLALENTQRYQQLVRSEARYRAMLHHARDAILLLDPDSQRIIDANPSAERLSGYTYADLLQLDMRSLLPQIPLEVTSPEAVSSVPTDTQSEKPCDLPEIEAVLQVHDGRSVPVSLSISCIPCDQQQLLLVVMRDMSKRWARMQQLIQTEKLTALGRLVSSIAHEINNPLQAIQNTIHLLINRSLCDEKRQRYLVMAQDEVEHLITLVQRVLEFYRSSREGMRPTNTHELLKSVLSMVANQLQSRRVRVVSDWYAELPPVLAIASHLKQVYLNLILNAIESMPNGGLLTIRTYVSSQSETPDDTTTSLAPSHVLIAGVPCYPHHELAVVIEFSDTGEGIPPEELPRVFEPFYTTRLENSGLGLAISYSIIEQHQGELSVSSAVGKGTTFRLRLPVVA
ncbi:MAG: GAF domain-containing protein [Chloroflexaceae bacterium]|nr:GAF domain-containing protein [Chloroflexaceae bacterium]